MPLLTNTPTTPTTTKTLDSSYLLQKLENREDVLSNSIGLLDSDAPAAGRVLLVCSYAPFVRALSRGFREEGLRVEHVTDASRVSLEGASDEYTCVVLDLQRRDDGDSILRRWLQEDSDLPITVLTVEEDQCGSSGHHPNVTTLHKPFSFEHLMTLVGTLTPVLC